MKTEKQPRITIAGAGFAALTSMRALHWTKRIFERIYLRHLRAAE